LEQLDKTVFLSTERLRALKLFTTKHKGGFKNRNDFADWFVAQLITQNCCCYYCETSIILINKLIATGVLKTRATGYGARGPVLEVDKKFNEQGYSAANCVLACYYCNNDKSYTLDDVVYKKYFGANRKAFFDYLLQTS